jgi:hypothetical protein
VLFNISRGKTALGDGEQARYSCKVTAGAQSGMKKSEPPRRRLLGSHFGTTVQEGVLTESKRSF